MSEDMTWKQAIELAWIAALVICVLRVASCAEVTGCNVKFRDPAEHEAGRLSAPGEWSR